MAEAYIDEAGRGRGAIKRLADIYERPEATIRDWIAAARRRGFLASTKPGRRGAAPGLNLPSHTAGHGVDMRAGATAPNLSRARRRHILRMVEGEGLLDTELGEDARLLYVVGGLVCNDAGFARREDLEAAMTNPEVLQAALDILDKARCREHNRTTKRSASRPAQRRSADPERRQVNNARS